MRGTRDKLTFLLNLPTASFHCEISAAYGPGVVNHQFSSILFLGVQEDRGQSATIHSRPPFDFHDPSIPGSTQRSLSGLIADSSSYYTRVTDGVKKRKAPPLLLEKWSLPVESNLSEPGCGEGCPNALVGRLLLSACFVNEFGRLANIRMEKRGPERDSPHRTAEEVDEVFGPPGKTHSHIQTHVEH